MEGGIFHSTIFSNVSLFCINVEWKEIPKFFGNGEKNVILWKQQFLHLALTIVSASNVCTFFGHNVINEEINFPSRTPGDC